MAHYSNAIEPNSYQPGTMEHRLNLDPATGATRFSPGSAEFAEIAAFLPEFDRQVSPAAREQARARRLAAEADAVQAAVASGTVPEGFTPVAHADPTASMSLGHAVGRGVYMVRHAQVEIAANMGFRPVSWPPR